MIDRFLDFLDRPLSRAAARAVLILTAAVCHGYVLLALLSIGAGGGGSHSAVHPAPTAHREAIATGRLDSGVKSKAARRRQDPQDQPGTPAARRADRVLRTQRALQHVPYRKARVRIDLIGADRGRAVLRVEAATRSEARRGWRAFLRRYRDDGSAYVVHFGDRGRGNG